MNFIYIIEIKQSGPETEVKEGEVIIKWIINLVLILNSNKKIGEVAGGITFGLMLALIPAGNLIWMSLLLITFFIKINFGAELLFLAIFKLFIHIFDQALDSIGLLVLSISTLENVYIRLFNLPVIPYTRFNNTIVMGGLIAGILLWVPAFFLFKYLVKLYRDKVRNKISNSKPFKWFIKRPIVSSVIKLFVSAGRLYSKAR